MPIPIPTNASRDLFSLPPPSIYLSLVTTNRCEVMPLHGVDWHLSKADDAERIFSCFLSAWTPLLKTILSSDPLLTLKSGCLGDDVTLDLCKSPYNFSSFSEREERNHSFLTADSWHPSQSEVVCVCVSLRLSALLCLVVLALFKSCDVCIICG